MAELSKIQWTDNTFSPWWGCARVSPACAHCYADDLAQTLGTQRLASQGRPTAGHQSLVMWDHLLVPYYGNGVARHVSEPVGTVTTRDRWSLVSSLDDIDILEVLFRMLEPHEIGRAMAFIPDYLVVGNKRQKVRQFGNAVTPPAAEVIVSALVEAITGEDLERAA